MSDQHPCIGCTGHFPDCRNHCADLDMYHAERDRKKNYGAIDTLMGIFGYTRCEAKDEGGE